MPEELKKSLPPVLLAAQRKIFEEFQWCKAPYAFVLSQTLSTTAVKAKLWLLTGQTLLSSLQHGTFGVYLNR